MNNLNVGE